MGHQGHQELAAPLARLETRDPRDRLLRSPVRVGHRDQADLAVQVVLVARIQQFQDLQDHLGRHRQYQDHLVQAALRVRPLQYRVPVDPVGLLAERVVRVPQDRLVLHLRLVGLRVRPALQVGQAVRDRVVRRVQLLPSLVHRGLAVRLPPFRGQAVLAVLRVLQVRHPLYPVRAGQVDLRVHLVHLVQAGRLGHRGILPH